MLNLHMLNPYVALIDRDLQLHTRRPGEWLMPIIFFVMVSGFFAMAFPYGPERLFDIAPGVIWTSLLLAMLFSLDAQYQADFKNGTLEQLLLSPHSLSLLMLSKTLAHWLAIGLPLTFISPLIAVLLQVPLTCFIALVATVGLGTLLLSLLATFGIVLTLGLHRGGILLTLLVLPLMFPVLLLGVSSLYAASQGLVWSGHLALIAALLIMALCLVPLTIAATLRASITLG